MQAAALLDRDGTIIVEKHYLSDPDQVELETGSIEGLRRLAGLGLKLVVVSNQSGIGRGKFPLSAAEAVNARIASILADEGIEIAAWYMCPHAPDVACGCRKPLPGMAQQAAAELGLDLAASFMIGDKRIDVEMGHAMGGAGILVTTGHGATDLDWARANDIPISANLAGAAEIVATMIAARGG